MNEIGLIEIKLENVSENDTIRFRESIHTLIGQGVLNIRNGKAVLHFDSDGVLKQIEVDFIKWKKLQENFRYGKIDINNKPNLTKAGQI